MPFIVKDALDLAGGVHIDAGQVVDGLAPAVVEWLLRRGHIEPALAGAAADVALQAVETGDAIVHEAVNTPAPPEATAEAAAPDNPVRKLAAKVEQAVENIIDAGSGPSLPGQASAAAEPPAPAGESTQG